MGGHCFVGYNIRTLVNVIIFDFTQINLVSQMTATLAPEVNEGFHLNHYSTNVFFSFVIKVFGCFHKQVNNLFH